MSAPLLDATLARPTPRPLRPLLAPMSGLLIAQFVAALSATVVATSLPAITTTLDGPASSATWLIAATILGNTATTPLWGRLCDLFPPKRIMLLGIVLFCVGSALAALSPTTGVLLTARAVQGVGLGGIHLGATVIIAGLLPPRERGRANGLLQSMNTTGTLLGPIVGGIVVEFVGWRWCFVIALPIAIAAIVVIALKLPEIATTRSRERTDYAGAALIATGIPAFLIALTMLGDDEGLTLRSALVGGYGILALAALVVVELHVVAPVVPLRTLAQRVPFVCAVAAFLLGSTMFGGTVFVTQYLQIGLGIEPAMAGLSVAPMAIGTVVTAWIAGRAISRTARVKPVLLVGASMVAAGNVLLAISPLAPLPLALVGAFLLAAGLGAGLQNLTLAAQTVASPDRIGSVSSTVGFFFALGGTVGLVAYGAVLSSRITVLTTEGASTAGAYALGIPTVFTFSAAAVVAAVVCIAFLPDIRLAGARAVSSSGSGRAD